MLDIELWRSDKQSVAHQYYIQAGHQCCLYTSWCSSKYQKCLDGNFQQHLSHCRTVGSANLWLHMYKSFTASRLFHSHWLMHHTAEMWLDSPKQSVFGVPALVCTLEIFLVNLCMLHVPVAQSCQCRSCTSEQLSENSCDMPRWGKQVASVKWSLSIRSNLMFAECVMQKGGAESKETPPACKQQWTKHKTKLRVRSSLMWFEHSVCLQHVACLNNNLSAAYFFPSSSVLSLRNSIIQYFQFPSRFGT